MVYSPMQEFDNIYDIDKGFKTGTIFSELDLPFNGRSLANKGGIGGCYDK
ncbi:MAG: spore coat associated protein CotJA [Clostridia bacterium]|nr:spore coat associated protein CotJA [Clostridia bacterium]